MRVLAILLIMAALGALGYLVVRYGGLLETEDPPSSPGQRGGGNLDGNNDDGNERPDETEPESEQGDTQGTANGGEDVIDADEAIWQPDWTDPDIRGLPAEWRNPRDGEIYLLVPGGVFIRGSNEGYNNGRERPRQTVFVSSFYIAKYAVSRRHYGRFIEAGAYADRERFARHWTPYGLAQLAVSKWTEPATWSEPPFRVSPTMPITGVSWFEAQAYASWVGGRLPREVEWEKAARGSDGREYPWGNDWVEAACNWRDVPTGSTNQPRHEQRGEFDGFIHLAPVDAYEEYTSPYGAVQMVGNAWEWCQDWMQDDFFLKLEAGPRSEKINPYLDIQDYVQAAESDLRFRVIKGGAFDRESAYMRAAFRHAELPHDRSDNVGFRVVLDVSYVRQTLAREHGDFRD